MSAATTTTTTVPTSVTAERLREWMASPNPPRILDVRTPGEFESVHIPGSYLVPLDTLREHRRELADHVDEDVVLVCRSGGRASQAEEALADAGAALTDTCAMGMALSKLPYNRADEPQIGEVLGQLAEGSDA